MDDRLQRVETKIEKSGADVRRLTLILSLFMLTLIALVVAAAMVTDIFKVEYNGTTRFQVDDKGTATINADTNAADVALRILSAPNSRGDIKFMVRTSDPTSPQAGDMWYNSTDRVFKMYDGSFKIPLGLLTPQIAIDSTANGNNGTLGTNSDMLRDSADPVWTSTAKLGGSALSFDGTDDNINVGNNASVRITGTLTVEAWIERDNTTKSTWDGILSKDKYSATMDRGYSLGVNTSGYLTGYITNAVNGSTFANPIGTTVLQAGTWYHVAMVYNGSMLKIYVNGVENGTTNWSSGIYDNEQIVAIGALGSGREHYFDGLIDEVAVWNVALTPAQVAARYNGGAGVELAGNESGLVSVWHMNDPK